MFYAGVGDAVYLKGSRNAYEVLDSKQPRHHIIMSLDQNERTFICQILDDHYERVDDFTSDMVTSDRIIDTIRSNYTKEGTPTIDHKTLHNLMMDFGYTGTQIPGSNEKLWKLRVRA